MLDSDSHLVPTFYYAMKKKHRNDNKETKYIQREEKGTFIYFCFVLAELSFHGMN